MSSSSPPEYVLDHSKAELQRLEEQARFFGDLTALVSGADQIMGLKLRQTYIDAGLPAPKVLITGRVDGGPDSPAYGVLVGGLRSLLPAAERYGVVDAKEVQIDTLAARLRDEVVAANATILLPLLFGA
jgi:hypothetical protein